MNGFNLKTPKWIYAIYTVQSVERTETKEENIYIKYHNNDNIIYIFTMS
jgi:hypothetical protein